jgi:ribose 5-phosphate isomerase A
MTPDTASDPRKPKPSAEMAAEMQAAAAAAVELIEPGAVVGLGTGRTAGHVLPLLAARDRSHTCVATSIATAQAAAELGLTVVPFTEIDRLDIAIDGADQIAPDGWLIKGGGGAQTRERIVAAAADRFVVIAASDKEVESLQAPVPLELLSYGLKATLRELDSVKLRDAPVSPDGGILADYVGPLDDPAALAAYLYAAPGVISHGLFEPALVHDIIVARGSRVKHTQP